MKGYNGLYLMGNYPGAELFVETALYGLKHFDFLEIGIPFTDPVADGPVIERAAHELIEKGFRMDDLLRSVRRIRDGAPAGKKLLFMTYANIVHSRGAAPFASLCRKAGVSGVILPDVPFEESAPFRRAFRPEGVDLISFITPENTEEQIRKIATAASGFLYCISIRGITGNALSLDAQTQKKIALARSHSRVPVVLGFGIRDRATAATALKHADGFIMGTAVIEALNRKKLPGVRSLLRSLEETA